MIRMHVMKLSPENYILFTH